MTKSIIGKGVTNWAGDGTQQQAWQGLERPIAAPSNHNRDSVTDAGATAELVAKGPRVLDDYLGRNGGQRAPHRRARGRLTPAELRAALASLELTCREFAHMLGVTVRTVERWLGGDRVIPELASRIIRASLVDPTVLVRIAVA
jgi:DNA-binding transcriptional regulator YiaG